MNIMFELIVYDCLDSLRRGCELTRCGELSLYTHLAGAPYAYVAFDFLRRNGLIWPMHDEDAAVERWVLSERGYEYLCRIEEWVDAVPGHLRVLARFGLCEQRVAQMAAAAGRAQVWRELS